MKRLVASTQVTPTPAVAEPKPIRVAAKSKKGKRHQNVFYDNRGFPDQSDEFDYLLHQTGGGRIIRKRLHPAPPVDIIDPTFNFPFDEAKHGEKLKKELKIDHSAT